MPKSKKNDESSGSDSEAEQLKPVKKSKKESKKKQASSDSDSGPDRTPVKKSKMDSKKSSKSSEEENKWTLGRNRFASLTEFKGTWYIDIREFYNNDGDMKPTKKGIMLTMEQWQNLKGKIGDIDDAIKQNV